MFFFQAEDGIRDIGVTGVQTCALPIWELIRWQKYLPICKHLSRRSAEQKRRCFIVRSIRIRMRNSLMNFLCRLPRSIWRHSATARSEEHTSELQSRQYLVCRLLLEKKKKRENKSHHYLESRLL